MTPADLVRKYLELRAYVEAATTSFEESLKPYKTGMETIEGAVHAYLDANNLQNFKVDDVGIAFKKSGTRVRMADRQAFNEFVLKQPNGLSFFTNSVAKEMILEYIKANEAPPPGIDFTRIIEVQIQKGR